MDYVAAGLSKIQGVGTSGADLGRIRTWLINELRSLAIRTTVTVTDSDADERVNSQPGNKGLTAWGSLRFADMTEIHGKSIDPEGTMGVCILIVAS